MTVKAVGGYWILVEGIGLLLRVLDTCGGNWVVTEGIG